jgi:protein-S-isoprenylcysteine O-methyltransferase Ste14
MEWFRTPQGDRFFKGFCMKRIWVRNWRIHVTRTLIVFLIVLFCISDAGWDHFCPIVSPILFTVGCVLAGIGIMGRLWCALYIGGYKTQTLITMGPYSISRNPLYFFSFIGSIGVGLSSETFALAVIIAIGFLFVYPRVILQEETRLRQVHGPVYEEYARRTPRFFPRWSLLIEPEEYVTHPVKFRRHVVSAMWFFSVIVLLEFIEALREIGYIKPLITLY